MRAGAELGGFHREVSCQAQGIDVDVINTELSGVRALTTQVVSSRPELDQALQTIKAMRNSPFWKAREFAVRLLRKIGLRRSDVVA